MPSSTQNKGLDTVSQYITKIDIRSLKNERDIAIQGVGSLDDEVAVLQLQSSDPPLPESGTLALYGKTLNTLYVRDSDGAVSEILSGDQAVSTTDSVTFADVVTTKGGVVVATVADGALGGLAPVVGQITFNPSLFSLRFFNGTVWKNVVGV